MIPHRNPRSAGFVALHGLDRYGIQDLFAARARSRRLLGYDWVSMSDSELGGELGGADGSDDLVLVVLRHSQTGERTPAKLRWRLLRHDAENPHTPPRPIFARAETVGTNPFFADTLRARRCQRPRGC